MPHKFVPPVVVSPKNGLKKSKTKNIHFKTFVPRGDALSTGTQSGCHTYDVTLHHDVTLTKRGKALSVTSYNSPKAGKELMSLSAPYGFGISAVRDADVHARATIGSNLVN